MAKVYKYNPKGLPTLKRNTKALKRFGIYYYHVVGNFTKQDTSGSTDSFERAIGHAASHCAKSELNAGEYAQALIIDRRAGRIVRSYKRDSGNNIMQKDYTK